MKAFVAFIIVALLAIIGWLWMVRLGAEKVKPLPQDEFQLEQIRINHAVDARLRKLETK